MSEKRTFFEKLRLAVLLVLVLAVLIVAFQNMDSVDVRILMAKFTLPQSVLMFGSLAAGFGLGVLWHGLLRRKK